METIKEIVGEMRGWWVHNNNEEVDSVLTAFANRIEAAHKREQENAIAATVVAAAKSASEVYEPHIKSTPIGNAAKMREALEKVIEIAKREWNAFRETSAMLEMHEICTAALSAPPRNCDLYATEDEAYQAHQKAMDDIPLETHVYYETWLFDEAKGN